MLAAITLTNPIMLGGLALLSLPIFAHLLNRGAHHIYYFPSIRLLQESYATQARVNKLRRLLLLLLRCLLVAAVVAAFARPMWRDVTASGVPFARQDSTVVIVLDASASMRQLRGGVPLMELARSTAARTVRELRAGQDVVNIVVADGAPLAVFSEPTTNFHLATSRINDVSAGQERADLPAAIAIAGQHLARAKGSRRLVIISDLQQTNYRELAEQKITTLPIGTMVSVVDLKTPVPENISLNGARTLPARPLIDQPTQFVIEVSDHGDRKKQIPISLMIDGRPSGAQTVEMEGGQQREVAFSATLSQAGERAVTFRTGADGLLVDNTHYCVVRTVEKTPILVLSDDASSATGTGAYFLTRALAPNGGVGDHFVVAETSSRQIGQVDLSQYPVVFVDYLSDLSADLATRLLDYLRGGGGVVFFCGEGGAQRQLTQLDATANESELVPWIPGPRRDLSAIDDALFIEGGKWTSPLIRDFDMQSQIALEKIRFSRVWGQGTVRPSGQVLLRFSDGSPAMVLGAVGFGEFLIANFSASVENSEIGKYGAYVALTQMLAKQLAQRYVASESASVGGFSRHALPDKITDLTDLTVTGPDGSAVELTPSATGHTPQIHLRRPPTAGFYSVQQADKSLMRIGVNVDPRESDLKRMAAADVQRLFVRAGLDAEIGDTETVPSIGAIKGRPLWGWMLGLGVMACCTELFLLGWWKR